MYDGKIPKTNQKAGQRRCVSRILFPPTRFHASAGDDNYSMRPTRAKELERSRRQVKILSDIPFPAYALYLALLLEGLAVPSSSRKNAVGSYPTFSPLPRKNRGGIFSAALSVTRLFSPRAPPFGGHHAPIESGLSSGEVYLVSRVYSSVAVCTGVILPSVVRGSSLYFFFWATQLYGKILILPLKSSASVLYSGTVSSNSLA